MPTPNNQLFRDVFHKSPIGIAVPTVVPGLKIPLPNQYTQLMLE